MLTWFWVGLAYARAVVSGLASVLGVVVAAAATALAFFPGRAAAVESWLGRRPWLARGTMSIVLALTVWGAVEQYWSSNALQDQIGQLTRAATMQATSEDVRGLRQEMNEQLRVGFDRMVAAIERRPVETARVTPAPTRAPEVRKINYTERPAPSDDPALPYGQQVIVQTSVTSQPTYLQVQFDVPVEKTQFFVAGQASLMNVLEAHSNGGKMYLLSFGFPAWTPEAPIVVSVLSKQPAKVVGISAAHW